MRPPAPRSAAPAATRLAPRPTTPGLSLDPFERFPDGGLAGQDLERLVVRYTACSLNGRRELVGDVHFGPAILSAAYGDPVHKLFYKPSSAMPRFLRVLFERL